MLSKIYNKSYKYIIFYFILYLLLIISYGCTTTQFLTNTTTLDQDYPYIDPFYLPHSSVNIVNKTYIEELLLEKNIDFIENYENYTNTGIINPSQLYITPDSPAVQYLKSYIFTVEDAYYESLEWIWISDNVLHNQSEVWLHPQEFLNDTPNILTNPVVGMPVSDCEEQAVTLCSLFRAIGLPPQNVRCVIGNVTFNDNKPSGHVWVEIWHWGRWHQLEATAGPYWNESTWSLSDKFGIDIWYYDNIQYPVADIWWYFNDRYYYNPNTNIDNSPPMWKL